MRVFRHLIVAGILATVVSCSAISTDLDRIVAIELDAPLTRQLAEGDTLLLEARALSARGELVPDADIKWVLLDLDSAAAGISLDEDTGTLVGLFAATGRVQARVDALRSQPISVTVTALPDSIAPVGETEFLVAATSTSSDPLQVMLLDTTADPANPLGVAAQDVAFTVQNNAGAGAIFVSSGEAEPDEDPLVEIALTNSTGTASVTVRKIADSVPPDTIFVNATANLPSGQPLVGSPIVFVVIFEPAVASIGRQ